MKLHIFNPEHDLALAANLSNFTAPHAGRQLRADLGFIPAIWAAAKNKSANAHLRLLMSGGMIWPFVPTSSVGVLSQP